MINHQALHRLLYNCAKDNLNCSLRAINGKQLRGRLANAEDCCAVDFFYLNSSDNQPDDIVLYSNKGLPLQSVETFQSLVIPDRTIEHGLIEGDIIVSNSGYFNRVLGVIGQVYLLSVSVDTKKNIKWASFGSVVTLFEIFYGEESYSLYKENDSAKNKTMREITLQEIADKFGIPVEQVRIKE